MRLTAGMLRQVIREEVEKVRRGRLYESMGDPERAELKAVAASRGHNVLDSDKIETMLLDDCKAFGFPPGTLYCNVTNFDSGGKLKFEPYLKFPGPKQTWAHESQARAPESGEGWKYPDYESPNYKRW